MSENKRYVKCEKMIEEELIDYKTELNKANNKLVDLRSRYDELKEDYDYIKSLNDKHFDEKIKLEKENEQLKYDNKDCAKRYRGLFNKYIKLQKENKELKQKLESEHTMLDNAILLERTRMGKNSLIQYREAIQ